MAEAYGSWATIQNRRRVRAYLSQSQTNYGTYTRISLGAHCNCDLIAEYGVRCVIGVDGGGWSTGNTGVCASGSNVAGTSRTYDVTRGQSAKTLKVYGKVYGEAVSGYGAFTGGDSTATITVTIPALESHTVSYNANGGAGAPGNQTKWYGTVLTLSSTVPTRTGYTFKGWATSSTGSVAYAAGGKYDADANVTLYAVWELITYTISYSSNGGSGSVKSQIKVYGTDLTLADASSGIYRTDYTLASWNTNAEGTGTGYAPGATYSENAGLSLYAQWAYNVYEPEAPTGLSATYKSDTSISLSWSNAAYGTAHREWAGVYIDRATDSGSWVQLTSLNAAATSYSDTSVSAGHRYLYRMRSYNSAGSTASNSSSYVYTSPTAFTAIAAAKPNLTDVSLTVTGVPLWLSGAEFQASADGGATWTAQTTRKTSDSVWTDSAPLAGTVIYRGRAYSTHNGTLYGPWTTSNQVVTICAPLAPSVSINDNATVYATGTQLAATWVPNHPDGTAQAKAQVEVTVPSGATSTHSISGAATSYTIGAAVTGTYKVRVRTYGLYNGWGEWSSYSTASVAVPPAVTFTNPVVDEAVVTELPLAVTWSIADSTGVSYQSFTFADSNGRTIVSSEPATSVREINLTGAHGIANNTAFTLTLTVRGGSGLTVTAVRKFSTKWTEPDPAWVTVNYDEGLAAHVLCGIEGGAIYDPEATEKPAISYYTVSRVNADGTSLLLGDNLDALEEVVDPLPPLNTEFEYMVVGHAESGVTSIRNFTTVCDSGGNEVFNFGTRAETALCLMYDADASESVTHSGESFHFATGGEGQDLPTFYPDGSMDVSGSHSYKLNSRADYLNVRNLSRRYAIGWFRSYWGWVKRVQVDFSTGYAADSYNLWDVSASITETVWEEPYGIGE